MFLTEGSQTSVSGVRATFGHENTQEVIQKRMSTKSQRSNEVVEYNMEAGIVGEMHAARIACSAVGGIDVILTEN